MRQSERREQHSQRSSGNFSKPLGVAEGGVDYAGKSVVRFVKNTVPKVKDKAKELKNDAQKLYEAQMNFSRIEEKEENGTKE